MSLQLKILLFLSSFNNQENSWRDTYKKFYFFKNSHYLSYITIINLKEIKFIFFFKSRSIVFKMSTKTKLEHFLAPKTCSTFVLFTICKNCIARSVKFYPMQKLHTTYRRLVFFYITWKYNINIYICLDIALSYYKYA